jgi:integrase
MRELAKRGLSRNTLRKIKTVVSAILRLAVKQGYFRGENPTHDTASARQRQNLKRLMPIAWDEIHAILARLSEPAATAFAVTAYTGLRHGEIQGLHWGDYDDGQIYVTRSIWNGRINKPKTRGE